MMLLEERINERLCVALEKSHFDAHKQTPYLLTINGGGIYVKFGGLAQVDLELLAYSILNVLKESTHPENVSKKEGNLDI